MSDQRNHKDQPADVSLPYFPPEPWKKSALEYGDDQAILLISEENSSGLSSACWLLHREDGYYLMGNELGEMAGPCEDLMDAVFGSGFEFGAEDTEILTTLPANVLFSILQDPAYLAENIEHLTINGKEIPLSFLHRSQASVKEDAAPITLHSLVERQAALPLTIPLYRYTPERALFPMREWQPKTVRSQQDLPPYLILGSLDASSFQSSAARWSARWQGTEEDTYFEVAFKTNTGRYEIRQFWRGVDGGYGSYTPKIPLTRAISEGLYFRFPASWDRAAKEQLEADYQVAVVTPPERIYTFCGIPDGAFRTIAIPVSVKNLRPARQWFQQMVAHAPFAYPFSVEARFYTQVVHYVEGKAPAWTTEPAILFSQSVAETGLVPQTLPFREAGNDGSAAWTLWRKNYHLFITLPFAGLTDFLARAATVNGPIRAIDDPPVPFTTMPIIFPASLEHQTQNLPLWNREKTTKSTLQFADAEKGGQGKVGYPVEDEGRVEELLEAVENIGAEVTEKIRSLTSRAEKE